MHINDIYALREQLSRVLAGEQVDRTTIRALMEAACDEITDFERHLELMAEREEAMQE